MAGFLDRFLNSMKLYDDDDEYEEDEYEEEREPAPAVKRSSRRTERQEEQPRRAEPVRRTDNDRQTSRQAARKLTRDNVVAIRGQGSMEVCMVKPTELDDAREVCDILLSGKAVVINMEGVHVDLAQRIIDFTSGAVFSINGNLQKISKYIFIVSPQSIGLTGDFTELVENSQDLSNLNLTL